MRAVLLASSLSLLPAPALPVEGGGDESLEVVGRGASEEMALRDALRQALEQASGLYVLSRAQTEMGVLTGSEVQTIALGQVRGYRILGREEVHGEVRLRVRIEVATNPLAKGRAPSREWTQEAYDASLIAHRQERLQSQAELLQAMVGDLQLRLALGYRVEYLGYLIADVGLHITGHHLVRIAPDTAFWESYEQVIRLAGESGPNTIKEGRLGLGFVPLERDCPRRTPGLGYAWDTPSIHQSLQPYLAAPLRVAIRLGHEQLLVTLDKNAILFGETGRGTDAGECELPKTTPYLRGQHPFYATPSLQLFDLPKNCPGIEQLAKGTRLYTARDRRGPVCAVDGEVTARVPFRLSRLDELKSIQLQLSPFPVTSRRH